MHSYSAVLFKKGVAYEEEMIIDDKTIEPRTL